MPMPGPTKLQLDGHVYHASMAAEFGLKDPPQVEVDHLKEVRPKHDSDAQVGQLSNPGTPTLSWRVIIPVRL
jgi:hypothetical protein